MSRAAFLPIIRSSWPYIGFGIFYADMMTICYWELLPGVAYIHQICIKCNKANVWLRTPDDGQKGCQKHVIVIPVKLDFSASVGFIHKEYFYVLQHNVIWQKVTKVSKESAVSIFKVPLKPQSRYVFQKLFYIDFSVLSPLHGHGKHHPP